MGRLEIIATAASVASAADEILRSGRNPTVDAVRTHLGGGSPNTVVRHLNAWRAGLGDRILAAEAAAPTPSTVTELAGRMWKAALAEALELEASRQQEARVTLALRAAELDDERRQIHDRERRLELELATATARQAEAAQQLAATESAYARERDGLAEFAQRSAAAESAFREIQSEFARVVAERDVDRDRHDRETARLLRDLDAERQRVRALEKTLTTAEQRHEKACEARDQERLKHAEQRAELRGTITVLRRQAQTIRKGAAPRKRTTRPARKA